MASPSQALQRACERKLAATLIIEARTKEYEAACYFGIGKNLDEARAGIHAALDALLDALFDVTKASKEEVGWK